MADRARALRGHHLHDARRGGQREERQLFHHQAERRPAPERPAIEEKEHERERHQHRLRHETEREREDHQRVPARCRALRVTDVGPN